MLLQRGSLTLTVCQSLLSIASRNEMKSEDVFLGKQLRAPDASCAQAVEGGCQREGRKRQAIFQRPE